MIVTRVADNTGSHIEPALDERWADHEKLVWQAAVTTLDTGLRTVVSESNFTIGGQRQHGYYDLRIGTSSIGPFTFHEAWLVLTGVSIGGQPDKWGNARPPADTSWIQTTQATP